MSGYHLKYLKYKSKYLNCRIQSGGNYSYKPSESQVINIEKVTTENKNYRQVIYTSDHSQLVLMSLKPGVEIGMEKHDIIDQFIRIESGNAKCSIGGKRDVYNHTDKDKHTTIYKDENQSSVPIGTVVGSEFKDLPKDHVLLVTRNTWHNIWNPIDSIEDVKIYTLYSFDKQHPAHKHDMISQIEKVDEPQEIKPEPEEELSKNSNRYFLTRK